MEGTVELVVYRKCKDITMETQRRPWTLDRPLELAGGIAGRFFFLEARSLIDGVPLLREEVPIDFLSTEFAGGFTGTMIGVYAQPTASKPNNVPGSATFRESRWSSTRGLSFAEAERLSAS
jgi:hypothetical protein